MGLYPQYNGKRFNCGGAIYMVMDGQKRHIADLDTFDRLCRNHDCYAVPQSFIDEIDTGPDLRGCCLAQIANRETTDDPVYLIDTENHIRRRIVSPAALDLYNFSNDPVRIDWWIMDAIPEGDPIDLVSESQAQASEATPRSVDAGRDAPLARNPF